MEQSASMTIIGEALLTNLLGYLLNLAAGERSAALAEARDAKLKAALEKEENLKKALESTDSIRDEIRTVCAELVRNRATLNIPTYEEPLWQLLTDDGFQSDLTDWLMAGGIAEGNAAKLRLLDAMEVALLSGGASRDQIKSFRATYFQAIEKSIFAHPVLAHWRHQLSLNFLREQVAILRQQADEAVGKYSPEKQKAALDRYCEKALEAWDIIDLSNLPEVDMHMAYQKLLLRQLYLPLRIEVEPSTHRDADAATLSRLEQLREARRSHEAGHFVEEEHRSSQRVAARKAVGEQLATCRRLVILGDPGGGKTTILRWLATAYLLQYKSDAAFDQIPDTDTIPKVPWIPVLIRCRDLGEDDLCRCFTDFLTQHLNKSELLPDEANVMRAVILDRIARGEALILVDGLDEITNPQVRVMFCQELEKTAARYPDAPIVVTSRIVGYRDMPYRMASGFQHGVIAELNRNDKDIFARRWVDVTEHDLTSLEKNKRVTKLLEALHSSDRIERLAGNPMLLTTLALVERKSGRLPNRRSELYHEAVQVLLNFNPRHRSLDKAEAIPQLAYLAFQMCYLGVQRLPEDEILMLLDKFRVDYPNVRAVKSHAPEVFLMLLEAQSSILIRAGSIWKSNDGAETRIWEFRHLTFQEYLASRALIDGRYPGRDKDKSLAEQVAPLAGKVEKRKNDRARDSEVDIVESWREALRLLVAECKDDDVDNVLTAIFNVATNEDGAKTSRPRKVLAALCLADEPNVSEKIASMILDGLVAIITKEDGLGAFSTTVSLAALELGKSMWSDDLKLRLMKEYLERPASERVHFGGLCGMIEALRAPEMLESFKPWFESVTNRLRDDDEVESTCAALVVMMTAYSDKGLFSQSLIDALFELATKRPPIRFAAVWALGWLSRSAPTNWGENLVRWIPQSEETGKLIECLQQTETTESDTIRWLLNILGGSGDPRAVQACVLSLDNSDLGTCEAAARAIGNLADQRATEALIAKLYETNTAFVTVVIRALGELGDKRAVAPLIGKLNDHDASIRISVIQVLAKIDDKSAIKAVMGKLDDPVAAVREQAIDSLVQLAHLEAVMPVTAKLDDANSEVREAAIRALIVLGDKQSIAPLVAKLSDPKEQVRVRVKASYGIWRLGDPNGQMAFQNFVNSNDLGTRLIAVEIYSEQRDDLDQQLLSRDIDGLPPVIDPQVIITEEQVTIISNRLGANQQLVRSRFEAMASDLKLKLSWKV